MPDVFYVSVVWTAGDILTEAKLDSMVANDRAVDSMNNGVQMTERADPSTPSSGNLHIYAKDKAGVSTFYVINDAGVVYEISENTPLFTFPFSGSLYVGTNMTASLIVPKGLQIIKVYGYVRTAPEGQIVIIDINKNGSSIWGSTPANRLTIASGSQLATQTSFDTVVLSESDILSMDIDQIGASQVGADLTVGVKCK